MRDQFKKEILGKLQKVGLWDIGGAKAEKLSRFMEDVWRWSGRIHLLGRKEILANIERQIIDSAYILQLLEENVQECGPAGKKALEPDLGGAKIADIGSGAGFPGLVWKMLRPRLEITLFERKQKIATFLSREIGVLGLKGVAVSSIDAAEYTEKKFDLAASKAAGRLPEILPLVSELLSGGGLYITVKGDGWKEKEGPGPFSGMELEKEMAMPEKRGSIVIFKKTN